jgi:putative DNA primase/helicase
LVGDPDVGKSYLTLDMAARVSCGASWPERGAAPRGKVLLLSAEDSVQDTIRPRLEGVRADLSRVIVVSSVCRRKRAAHFNLATDLQALRRLVATDPEYRLVVIDPISAYMGDLDTNSNSLVRGALSPLAAWAAEAGVAVVCVSHLRKSEGAVVYRTMGSLAFTAAARAVWAVTRDSQDETGQRRVLWPVKNNLSADRTSLAFCIVSDEGGSRGAYLRWETPQEEPFWET